MRNSFPKYPLHYSCRTDFELHLNKRVARNNTTPNQIGLPMFKLTGGGDFLSTQRTITYICRRMQDQDNGSKIARP